MGFINRSIRWLGLHDYLVLIALAIIIFMVRFKRRHPDSIGARIHGGILLEITWSVVPLLISLGNPIVLITSPLSAVFLVAALALLVSIAVPAIRAQREVAMKE